MIDPCKLDLTVNGGTRVETIAPKGINGIKSKKSRQVQQPVRVDHITP